MDTRELIYSTANGHLGCFLFLAIMNKATINIHGQAFVVMYDFISFGYI